jgi:hypothetical protein
VYGGYASELHTITKIALYYIKLPLYLICGFDLNNSNKLVAGIGPYFAYGIYGKMRSEFIFSLSSNHWIGKKNIFKEDYIRFNESTLIGYGDNIIDWIREPYWHKPIKRFDGGISGFIGYELHNSWLITATYDIGLINPLYPTEKLGEKFGGKMHNHTISISLGYKFSK